MWTIFIQSTVQDLLTTHTKEKNYPEEMFRRYYIHSLNLQIHIVRSASQNELNRWHSVDKMTLCCSHEVEQRNIIHLKNVASCQYYDTMSLVWHRRSFYRIPCTNTHVVRCVRLFLYWWRLWHFFKIFK